MFDLSFHAPKTPPPAARPWAAADTTRLYREHLDRERRLGLLPKRKVRVRARKPKRTAGYHTGARALKPAPQAVVRRWDAIDRGERYAAILEVAAKLYRPGDQAGLSEIARAMAADEKTIRAYVLTLRKRGVWPYKSPGYSWRTRA